MRQAERNQADTGRNRQAAYLKPVSSLRTLASSSEEGALLGLREAFLDECREDAADLGPTVVAFTPSKNSLLAAFREVVLPPPRARRRRSIWTCRSFERAFFERKEVGGRWKKRRPEDDPEVVKMFVGDGL